MKKFVFLPLCILWMILVSSIFTVSCTSSDSFILSRARKFSEEGRYREALAEYDNYIKRNPEGPDTVEALKEAAKLAHLETKNYEKAKSLYREVILKSPKPEDRLQAQAKLAEIEFVVIQNYEKAIVEFGRLNQVTSNQREKAQIKLNIARCYLYLNHWFQALAEIDDLLRMATDDDLRFQAFMLRANIFISRREFNEAITQLLSMIKSYPKKAQEENSALLLAAAYEENGQFLEAIKTMESMKETYNPKEYIELRIKRLQERQRNRPGAKGYRK